jgi:hypothetical protein
LSLRAAALERNDMVVAVAQVAILIKQIFLFL